MAAFRKAGASVQDLHIVGKGCPDILIGYGFHSIPVEIKDGSKPPSKRKLSPAELEWHKEWRGSVGIAYSVDDVAIILNGLRR